MSNNPQIYQFKVHLKDINPMIWRRFLIQSDSTLKDRIDPKFIKSHIYSV